MIERLTAEQLDRLDFLLKRMGNARLRQVLRGDYRAAELMAMPGIHATGAAETLLKLYATIAKNGY